MAIGHDALSLSLSHHACFMFLLFAFLSFQDIPFSEGIRDRRKGEERICSVLVREGMFLFFSEGSQSGRRTSVRVSFVVVVFWLLQCLVFCFDIHDHTHKKKH